MNDPLSMMNGECQHDETTQYAPRLRFQEFEGDWELTSMGQRFTNSKLKGLKGLPTLSVTLDRGLILRDHIDRETKTNLAPEEHRLVKKGEIAYNMMRMWQGAYGRAAFDGIVSPAYIILSQSSQLRSDFSEYFLKLSKTRYLFWAYSYGVTNDRLRLYFNDFSKIKSHLPSLPEQAKIASFLTSVDDRIDQLKRKKSLLQDYKKGVMQRLFAAGKKSVELGVVSVECQHDASTQHSTFTTHHSLLRFKDDQGNAFPDWCEKKLGEVATFSKGKGISKAQVHADGATPCIRYGELYTHYIELITTIKSHTNLNPLDLEISEGNDVIIPASGETHLDIATASCVAERGVALGGDLNIIRSKENGVFMAYYMNSALRFRIAGLAQGSSVIHLYATQLKSLQMQIPTLPEQTKIANFLTAIDQKIEQVSAQITETQNFKKGLLQQMFV